MCLIFILVRWLVLFFSSRNELEEQISLSGLCSTQSPCSWWSMDERLMIPWVAYRLCSSSRSSIVITHYRPKLEEIHSSLTEQVRPARENNKLCSLTWRHISCRKSVSVNCWELASAFCWSLQILGTLLLNQVRKSSSMTRWQILL